METKDALITGYVAQLDANQPAHSTYVFTEINPKSAYPGGDMPSRWDLRQPGGPNVRAPRAKRA
jgi:hypothetical protein